MRGLSVQSRTRSWDETRESAVEGVKAMGWVVTLIDEFILCKRRLEKEWEELEKRPELTWRERSLQTRP